MEIGFWEPKEEFLEIFIEEFLDVGVDDAMEETSETSENKEAEDSLRKRFPI